MCSAVAVVATAAPARGGDADTPARGDARLASKKFAEAENAYRLGDFTRAGEAFEAAYEAAPHADALWNAARAWQRAGESVRAANLYARYLREAAPNAPDRNHATTALSQLSSKLGRIELHAEGADEVSIDGRAVERTAMIYVAPGRHVVRARRAERASEQVETVAAGAVVSVAFGSLDPPPDAQPARSPTAVAAAPAPPPRADQFRERKTERSGWSPVVVWIGGGITIAAGAASIWSGLDTLSARDSFVASPSQGGLDDGRTKQLRTNILFAVTGVAATATVAAAVFFVDWGGRRVEVAAGAGMLVARGRF